MNDNQEAIKAEIIAPFVKEHLKDIEIHSRDVNKVYSELEGIVAEIEQVFSLAQDLRNGMMYLESAVDNIKSLLRNMEQMQDATDEKITGMEGYISAGCMSD